MTDATEDKNPLDNTGFMNACSAYISIDHAINLTALEKAIRSYEFTKGRRKLHDPIRLVEEQHAVIGKVLENYGYLLPPAMYEELKGVYDKAMPPS